MLHTVGHTCYCIHVCRLLLLMYTICYRTGHVHSILKIRRKKLNTNKLNEKTCIYAIAPKPKIYNTTSHIPVIINVCFI